MQTNFTLAQLADPDIRESDAILRSCVHCGFCTATCPTYVLLGDELDSPRGRIYLIKDMLEHDRKASAEVVTHIDRCLTCLACMTTCPAGVHYQHLVDHARRHIARTYRRPAGEATLRALLGAVLPHARRFRAALALGRLARPLAPLLPGRLKGLLALAPDRRPGHPPPAGVHPAAAGQRMRVALLTGCVQDALAPEINAATLRLLTRLGCEVVVPRAAGCCGGLVHHMGEEEAALRFARANVAAWRAAGPIDAVAINASGCGVTVRDYGHLLRHDPDYAADAAALADKARDVTEVIESLGLGAAAAPRPLAIAYHAACSLQHGQHITQLPKRLLEACGFEVCDPAESHLCCGSAGTYSMLQPDLARRLGARKAANLDALASDVIAAGNLGCMVHLAGSVEAPLVHTVELLDWATGGPEPPALAGRGTRLESPAGVAG